jgi:hypothetical protein
MTNEEAKFMLQGYRPNGADAKNEAFAAALAQAERDPALREWFEREQAFDAAVAGKLREIAPPAGLRESILAGTRMSSVPVEDHGRAWWLQPWSWGVAAAAAVVLVFSLVYTRPSPESQPALVRMEPVLQLAMADMSGSHGPGAHASALGAFGAWIMDGNSRLQSVDVPLDLDELRAKGCRIVNIAGHDVFEVCFKRESGWYHLYVMPRAACDPSGLKLEPMFHEQGAFVAASWADENFAYLVAGATDLGTLRGLL